jgi:hypothetical protein
MARCEAIAAPDNRIQELTEHSETGTPRSIRPTSPETIVLPARGHGIVYRFEDGGSLRGLSYLEFIEATHRVFCCPRRERAAAY